jgi:putative membrane protein insertion efficiency factor
MKKFFLYTIGLYRRYLSPLLPPACRFTPTCSEYAVDAFTHKSTGRAIWMTLIRISKCQPFHPGGYDPVDLVGKEDFKHKKVLAIPPPSSLCCGHKKR